MDSAASITPELFCRQPGAFGHRHKFGPHHIGIDGQVMTEDAWKKHEHEWLPSPADHAFVQSLMTGRCVELGRFANWIAPPRAGINNQPLNFEYVRFN